MNSVPIGIGEALWVIFGLLWLIAFATSGAFYYHWGRFAPSHAGAIGTIVVYTVGLATLFLGMLGILASL